MLSRRRFLGSSVLLSGLFSSRPGGALEGPSRTALGAARYRAAHQLIEDPRVLEDPYALRILGRSEEAWIRQRRGQLQTGGQRAMRAFIALRSRYAEDRLAEAFGRGVRQYVVLGAGLDTFAYRNPHAGLRVFEVDHPATQQWKRARLKEAGVAVPASLTFAPVDFERQTLGDGLKAAGFDAAAPAFFSMLGVVVYLTRDATMGTMRYVASLPAGSEIVFDFALPEESVSEGERQARASRAGRVASIGEPWISYFDAEALAKELRALGFSAAQVLDSAQANERYFKDRADGFRLYGSGRMMAARV